MARSLTRTHASQSIPSTEHTFPPCYCLKNPAWQLRRSNKPGPDTQRANMVCVNDVGLQLYNFSFVSFLNIDNPLLTSHGEVSREHVFVFFDFHERGQFVAFTNVHSLLPNFKKSFVHLYLWVVERK